jgi:16S rRNA processing protein RimM
MGAHGVQGWVKIRPFSSDSSVLATSKRWWLGSVPSPLSGSDRQRAEVKPIDVVWAKPHGDSWLACLKGLNDRDQAQALKGHSVLVARSAFAPLPEDEYYWVDLMGCDVSTDAHGALEHLGVVQDIQDNPAHPILVVRQQQLGADGARVDCLDDKGKPIYSLIPFVAAHIAAVDLSAKQIQTHWPRDF